MTVPIDPWTFTDNVNETASGGQINDRFAPLYAILAKGLSVDNVVDGGVVSRLLKPTVGVVSALGNTPVTPGGVDVSGASLAVTPVVASNLLVVFFASVSFAATLEGVTVSLQKDGVAVAGTAANPYVQNNATAIEFHSVIGAASIALSAAAHTVKMRAASQLGNSTAVAGSGTGFAYLLTAA